MGRFSDDIPLKPRGSVVATTVPVLLRKLHVKDAPFETKKPRSIAATATGMNAQEWTRPN